MPKGTSLKKSYCRGLIMFSFSFRHCVVCPSIYRFRLPLWYLQTLGAYKFFPVVSCCSFCPITCVHVFSSVLWCPLRFLHKTMFGSYAQICFVVGSSFSCTLYLFTYIDVKHDFHGNGYVWSFNSNTLGATNKAGTAYTSGAPGYNLVF